MTFRHATTVPIVMDLCRANELLEEFQYTTVYCKLF